MGSRYVSALLSCAIAIVPVYSDAATFYVNSEEDLQDKKPGDGVAIADNGKTTFRAAIEEANALRGADTIVFIDYAVEEIDTEIAYVYGPLYIRDDLTVLRDPNDWFWVSCRFSGSEPYRAFEVFAGVKFEVGLGINFIAYEAAAHADLGGFMYMHPGSEVHLDGVHSSTGVASIAGGCAYVDHATLYVANGLSGETTGDGGGIYNDHGTVVGDGRGRAARGGGIYNNHGIVVTNRCFGGSATQAGGGIYSAGGYVGMTRGSVRVGPTPKGGGLFLAEDAVVELAEILFEGNTATESGAAIYVESGTLRASQCHFASGEAGDSGGAVYVAGGEATFLNCTFAGNAAAAGGAGAGGAIAVAPGALCRIGNSLAALNTALPGQPGPELWGQFVSLGHNAIGIADGAGGLAASDLLGSLAAPLDTGVLLVYRAPDLRSWPRDIYFQQPGSILIDAGDSALLGHPDYVGNACFDISGAGYPRVRNAAADIGCFEFPQGAELDSCIGVHSSDTDRDGAIGLPELLRAVQLYNSAGFHCDPLGEDGFAPSPGDTACAPHASDYAPQDWTLGLSELLRLVQLYNVGAYHPCDAGEDGYCLGP